MKSARLAGLEEPGRLEAEVLDEEQARRPDRLDGERVALGHDQALLVAERRRHDRGDEEQDQPEVGQQRRHLRVLVPIAVEVADPVDLRLAELEAMPAQRRPDARRRPTPVIAARSGQRRHEERVGLDDPDLGRLAPQPRRPVERADDDRDDEDEQPDA